MSSPFKGCAAILVWRLSSFTTIHGVLVGKEFLSVLPLSVFRASLWFLSEFQFCSCKMLTLCSECTVPQTSPCIWGYRQKSLWCRAAFYAWLSDGRFYRFLVPLCCWKCLGMCSQLLLILYLWKEGLLHAVTRWFLSVLISSLLIYLIFTLESFGMQTHVKTSSWESTELHLQLLAVVHGHTTVCIILALDKANSSMDIKSWHSIYMLLSGPVSVPLTRGDTFFCGSLHCIQIYLYLPRCSWNMSQKKRSYLQAGLT